MSCKAIYILRYIYAKPSIETITSALHIQQPPIFFKMLKLKKTLHCRFENLLGLFYWLNTCKKMSGDFEEHKYRTGVSKGVLEIKFYLLTSNFYMFK